MVVIQDHPVLKGHFPGSPVVPGAFIVRAIHDALEMATGARLRMIELSQVKFLHPLLPSENPEAILKISILNPGETTFRISASLQHGETIFTRFKGTFEPC